KTIHVRSLPNLSTITVSGRLPAGVAFVNNGDNSASLVGTPAAGSAGSYPLTVTASNGIGSAAQESVSLVVKS
ncbi:MAG TPA: putative Ig domain-containing protein, partial [Acidimicrobiales bacterium]|nr:putative Ig domain-containing protein [Acidimicrobiales bacterium]